MVKEMYVNKRCETLPGIFVNDLKGYKIIDSDTDCYDKKTGKVVFKLRKNVLTEESIATFKTAIPKITSVAKNGTNRSLTHIMNNLKDNIDINDGHDEGDWSLEERIANLTHIRSNIWGSYDKPLRAHGFDDVPCRKTSLTVKHYDRWKMMHPIVQQVNKWYKQLAPKQWKAQNDAVKYVKEWCIPNTCYSTITINADTQMVTHRDANDFEKGLGNLVSLRYGDYTGGETLFPDYKVGVDLQEGDILIMDVHQTHCNAPIEGTGRVSIVCYLRENITRCV
jgi:hypothetical protein